MNGKSSLLRYAMREFSTCLAMNYPFSSLVPNNVLLEIGIIQLISFLCELVAHLNMIQSHAKSGKSENGTVPKGFCSGVKCPKVGQLSQLSNHYSYAIVC
jgi:hypothetical protein